MELQSVIDYKTHKSQVRWADRWLYKYLETTGNVSLQLRLWLPIKAKAIAMEAPIGSAEVSMERSGAHLHFKIHQSICLHVEQEKLWII